MPNFSFPDRPRPRNPDPAEIAGVRDLMANERNALLLAPHGVVLYSMFTEQLSGALQFLWRSRRDTLHSRYIDTVNFFPRYVGRTAMAPVRIHLFDSSSPRAAAAFSGLAGLVHDPDLKARATQLYRDIRLKRGENPEPKGTETELYAADITAGTVTVPRVDAQGDYRGEGHGALYMPDLSGFEAGRHGSVFGPPEDGVWG